MEIITENKGYKFSELSTEAKERAKQDYYDGIDNGDSCEQFEVMFSDKEYSELSDGNDYKYYEDGELKNS